MDYRWGVLPGGCHWWVQWMGRPPRPAPCRGLPAGLRAAGRAALRSRVHRALCEPFVPLCCVLFRFTLLGSTTSPLKNDSNDAALQPLLAAVQPSVAVAA